LKWLRTDPVLNGFYDSAVARRIRGNLLMNLSSTIERTVNPTLRVASVRVSRQLAAAPERVFDACLDAEEAQSFLFAGWVRNAISSEIDARVGGRFRIVRHQDGEDVEYSGEYLEIDRPHRLVFSLFVEKYAQRDDRVIVELAPVVNQSLLVLTHELSLPDPVARSRIQREWARVLDRLGALYSDGCIPSGNVKPSTLRATHA
jgi:uncharacterized protein YndB with AHSA1/START domain